MREKILYKLHNRINFIKKKLLLNPSIRFVINPGRLKF